jgi:hypothetical protein
VVVGGVVVWWWWVGVCVGLVCICVGCGVVWLVFV